MGILYTIIACSIEASHIKEVSKDMIVEWFGVFNNAVEEYQIIMENIYNMHEMGFPIIIIQNAQVMINSNIKMKYQA